MQSRLPLKEDRLLLACEQHSYGTRKARHTVITEYE